MGVATIREMGKSLENTEDPSWESCGSEFRWAGGAGEGGVSPQIFSCSLLHRQVWQVRLTSRER